jgi:hypothetical protein
MSLRLATSLLAVVALALSTADLGRIGFDVLLVAVVAGAAAGLEAVAGVVDRERSRTSAVLAGLALLSLVAAGATRTPAIALGCLACYGLDRVQLRVWARGVRAAAIR